MAARGKQSAAAASVAPVRLVPGERPRAPKELSRAQAKIWKRVVDSESVDFFNTEAKRSLLADYCRHTDSACVLSERISAMTATDLLDDESVERYERLLKMRDRETKAAADKATKLRITNQSRYTPHAAATAAKNSGGPSRPWEFGKK